MEKETAKEDLINTFSLHFSADAHNHYMNSLYLKFYCVIFPTNRIFIILSFHVFNRELDRI